MKVPLSWLKDYVDITLPVDKLAERLTLAGLEVESVTRIGEMWERDKLFVGQILAVTQHPDADRLVLARVEYGAAEPLTVVTGAPNLYPYAGQDLNGRGPKVAFAVVGARLIDGHSAERKIATLKAGKIRGIVSQGMVCSEKELDLSDEHEGILILPDDAPVGMPLVDYMGDAVVEFDIKGAFGHLQCVVGIARETAALTGQPMRRDVLTILDRQPVAIVPDADFTGIVIQAPDLCLRYSAALIEGVQVAPSPLWMQQRLARAGMRPINNVVDITNYVMLELGQPLHAFDYELLRERRRPRRRPADDHHAPRAPRRAPDDPRRRGSQPRPGHADDHRHRGHHRRRRRDGRREHRGERRDDRRAAGGGQLRLPEHPPHQPTAQALQRGGQPLRQARRSGADRDRAGAGRSTAGGTGRRQSAPGLRRYLSRQTAAEDDRARSGVCQSAAGRGCAGGGDGADSAARWSSVWQRSRGERESRGSKGTRSLSALPLSRSPSSPSPPTARTSTFRPTWWKRSAASTATTGCRTR